MHRLLASLLLTLAVVATSLALPGGSVPTRQTDSTAHAQAGLPPLPAGWPSTLQLGRTDFPNGAANLRAIAPFGYRYQYLSAGVNTGHGWATWNEDGHFVTYYVQESQAAGITPVFTYYMIFQSLPGAGGGEQEAVLANLKNTATMQAYWADMRLFFQRAGAFPGTRVVFHVEPDLWGYVQQRASGDNAATIQARVGSTGVPELAGLPDTVAGFAQAVIRLRDQYAPNVQLGYHVSVWGTDVDISISDPPDHEVDALGARAATFYRSLGADFDLAFGEFSDRDSAFKQAIYGQGPEAWWNADDFRRHVRFVSRFVADSGKRMVLWQIPLGNTKMRAVDNTWDHYQDNRVEWLLDDPTRSHLTEYVNAGAIAFLFGRGAEGATASTDAAGDGVTNPAPINGNGRASLSAADDGGFFDERAQAYYQAGPLALPGGGGASPPPATATPTATPVPAATPVTVSCSPRPPVAVQSVAAGGRLQVTVSASGPGNHLTALRVTRTENASIEVAGQSGRTAPFEVSLPAGTIGTGFAVSRASAGPATVSLVVVDACGEWPTFVGGGPSAF